MKKQAWVEKIAESSLAQILIFSFFLILIGSFTFLAFHARANLAPVPDLQVTLAQQAGEIRTAGSMNDLYDKGWLADDRNFFELAGYIDKLLRLPTGQALDPAFKQELGDYIRENQARLPQESSQFEELSFTAGILRQDRSHLLEMYDQLGLVFHTMEDFVLYWDLNPPQERAVEISTLDYVFSTAAIQFQTTTSAHRKILDYVRRLDEQSQQAKTTELDRIRNSRTQLTLALGGLAASGLALVGWSVWWKRKMSEL